MAVCDKTPDYLLINKDYLQSAANKDDARQTLLAKNAKSSDRFLSVIISAVPFGLACVSSYKTVPNWVQIAYVICSIGFAIFLIFFGIEWHRSSQELKTYENKSIVDTIIGKVKDDIRYTAILVVAYYNKDGHFKILTDDDYFLAHCPMDPSLSAIDQKSAIIKYLGTTYSIAETDILSVIPMDENPTFSIKPVHDRLDLNAFIIFSVHLKKRAKSNLVNRRGTTWLTIAEMKKRPEAMGTNRDVINMLEELSPKLSDSFEDSIGPLHIIWNITKACDYNCSICATHDSYRMELSATDKIKVLNSICTARAKIRILDFAGGDPCCSDESVQVIKSAINILDTDRVSVTTTGTGLKKLCEDDRIGLLTQCEITIDAAHESLSSDTKAGAFSRQQEKYSTTNFSVVHDLFEHVQKLVINIPILDDDLTDEEIDTLVHNISDIKAQYSGLRLETQLLRLMPVGAFIPTHRKDDYISHYNPIVVAKKIKEKMESLDIECRYHCSLRILPEINDCAENCGMLLRKLGIDCAGNIFACAWGAYFPLSEDSDITQNPFYLGNLLETNLNKLLDENLSTKTEQYRNIFREVNSSTKRSFCSVISWYNQRKLFENHDPLSPTN